MALFLSSMKSRDLRERFTDYFARHGHHKIPSSSLIPEDDPTLLFTNAGMNQFKDYFTGKAKACHPRASTIQKCVRAGGKHNDLENVGHTPRHHTFFEMLGNFSFGDYFKKEAIHLAFDFLTKELGIPQDKLFITVHESDDEAHDIWHKDIGFPAKKIFRKGDRDNFWEMGPFGPCGPCSEIFYDHGPQYASKPASSKAPLDDEERYVEIWNLVFMQFEKTPEGTFELPKPSVDTGAGLERLAALMQGKYWNYDSDLFTPLISRLQDICRLPYGDESASSFRVVADHVRASAMLITDGAIPSNEGRGHVLRRIIRRAVRYLRKLDPAKASLSSLLPEVFQTLGEEYPQNAAHKALAKDLLDKEEQKFLKTLDSGMSFLEEALKRHVVGQTFSGKTAFKLYDTYGFPKDLTEIILKEKNLKLDHTGFDKAQKAQREMSKKSWKGGSGQGEDHKKLFYSIKEKHGPTVFLGQEKLEESGTLLGLEKVGDGEELFALVFDRVPFYGESGGQVGDCGLIAREDGQPAATVMDTQKPVEDLHVLYSKDAGDLEVGTSYLQKVDPEKRKATTQNHSATHLLQSALIEVLGNHIKQAGSHVNWERLRFDFTHSKALSLEQIRHIEEYVNKSVTASHPVSIRSMPKEKARELGAIAMFGEKYGEEVRVVQMGDVSLELCGGTHVGTLSEIGLFSIVSESSLSSGVRRIEAVTGKKALDRLRGRSEALKQIERQFSAKDDDLPGQIQTFKARLKELEKENSKLCEKIQSLEGRTLLDHPEKCGDYLFKAAQVEEGMDMKKLSDQFTAAHPKGLLFLYGKRKGKWSFLLRAHKNLKDIDCSAILGETLKGIGGRGGGRQDMAQGSGGDKADIKKLIAQITRRIQT
ncbi:MAG: alanine--tRNA ligase [Bacteriovoracales bacterium]|nr:alanine--tRNA ligase [Bacteriovoracales bacterium]